VFILLISLLLKHIKFSSIQFGKLKFNNSDNTCFNRACSAEKINHFTNELYAISKKIDRIEIFEISLAQMKFIKQNISILKQKDIDEFNLLIAEKNKTKKIIQMYEAVVYRVYRELEDLFEIAMIDNHLDEYEEGTIEWESYLTEKINYFTSVMNNILKYNYVDNRVVSYTALLKNMEKNFNNILELKLKNILIECRKIKLKYMNIVSDLYKEKVKLIDNICKPMEIN
jgi:hypothetical protein